MAKDKELVDVSRPGGMPHMVTPKEAEEVRKERAERLAKDSVDKAPEDHRDDK